MLVDDIVDSGGTLVNAADALLAQGAKAVYAYISHGVLSGGAVARVAKSRLKELVITELDPADQGSARLRQYPRAADRHSDRRGDRAHRDRRVGVESVRLNGSENKTELAGERIPNGKVIHQKICLSAAFAVEIASPRDCL